MRLLPYENREPSYWEERVKKMQETPLYLVNTTGPTCYSVRGEESNRTFKVYIGERQLCSCGGGKDIRHPQLCIHILYVMIKVLRTPLESPIAWQLSLVDSEVDQILQGRFARMESRVGHQPHSFLKKRSNLKKGDDDEGGVPNTGCTDRHPLNPDEVCPICQDEMTSEQPLTYCKRGCGNNLHVKCMRLYSEFQKSSSTKVVCPLCRSDWGGAVIKVEPWDTPTDDADDTRVPQDRDDGCPPQLFRTRCAKCSSAIHAHGLRSFYRCLLCPPQTSDQCQTCFKRTDTSRTPADHHHHYVEGKLEGDVCAWRSAHKGRNVPLPADVVRDMQNRDLGATDYDALLCLDQTTDTSLPHHLLKLLPMLNADPAGQEETGDPPTCGGCAVSLAAEQSCRCLPCGHVLHESCALSAILEATSSHDGRQCQGSCPTCGAKIFSTFILRKRGKKKKKSNTATHETPETRAPSAVRARPEPQQLSDMMISGTEIAVASLPRPTRSAPHSCGTSGERLRARSGLRRLRSLTSGGPETSMDATSQFSVYRPLDSPQHDTRDVQDPEGSAFDFRRSSSMALGPVQAAADVAQPCRTQSCSGLEGLLLTSTPFQLPRLRMRAETSTAAAATTDPLEPKPPAADSRAQGIRSSHNALRVELGLPPKAVDHRRKRVSSIHPGPQRRLSALEAPSCARAAVDAVHVNLCVAPGFGPDTVTNTVSLTGIVSAPRGMSHVPPVRRRPRVEACRST